MYKVKNEGRNAHAFYSETLTLALRERANIEKSLHRRLDDDALVAYYQPKYCLSTLKVVGVEALVRMKDDYGAIIPPDKFIHFTEESGLVRQIGEQALDQSCKQVRQCLMWELPWKWRLI